MRFEISIGWSTPIIPKGDYGDRNLKRIIDRNFLDWLVHLKVREGDKAVVFSAGFLGFELEIQLSFLLGKK